MLTFANMITVLRRWLTQNIVERGIVALVDTQYLVRKIDESGIKKQKICEELGISRTVWARRISGKSSFRMLECNKIAEVLGLTQEEYEKIFFAEQVNP